jgi:hypothetical protein
VAKNGESTVLITSHFARSRKSRYALSMPHMFSMKSTFLPDPCVSLRALLTYVHIFYHVFYMFSHKSGFETGPGQIYFDLLFYMGHIYMHSLCAQNKAHRFGFRASLSPCRKYRFQFEQFVRIF